MADVAAEAHVSVKTVSRVVNHEPGVRVDTVERVKAVMDRLGFRRFSGSQPGSARSLTIALVVENLVDPFYAQIGAAVEREARIRHHHLITASAEGSPIRERGVLEDLVERRVDGLVIVPAGETPSMDPSIAASGIPIVFVDRPVRGQASDAVLGDNRGRIRSAMEHLVAHGHPQICFLGDDPGFGPRGSAARRSSRHIALWTFQANPAFVWARIPPPLSAVSDEFHSAAADAATLCIRNAGACGGRRVEDSYEWNSGRAHFREQLRRACGARQNQHQSRGC
ncbi:LacI family DNA-binding transcriptional regulator [Nocardia sp. NPDC051787]|uniref:LacI family DNA-binding transcriptional regulator n=1 Tax=Nocardia sp. NPDC051787 TaxID=3155415 RepID=UPI00343433A3